RELRLGQYDVLAGFNLPREGPDPPEVWLGAILAADREGSLRSDRSLTQPIGRAARNVPGRVIMYADTVPPPTGKASDGTTRRGRAAVRAGRAAARRDLGAQEGAAPDGRGGGALRVGPDELREYALSKPGAWPDQPWEGDVVAKVGERDRGKIFAFLGADTVG